MWTGFPRFQRQEEEPKEIFSPRDRGGRGERRLATAERMNTLQYIFNLFKLNSCKQKH